MARYRVRFIASFNQIIYAENMEEARNFATERAEGMSLGVLATDGELRCAWNTIEPLSEAADDN